MDGVERPENFPQGENRHRVLLVSRLSSKGPFRSLKLLFSEVFADFGGVAFDNAARSALSTPKGLPWAHCEAYGAYFGVPPEIFWIKGRDKFDSEVRRLLNGKLENNAREAELTAEFEGLISEHSVFVGREALLARLEESASGRTHAIIGEPGSGKTALLVELIRRLRQRDDTVVVQHFFQRGSFTATTRGFLQNICQSLAYVVGVEVPVALTTVEELKVEFQQLLGAARTASVKDCFVVIDAVDEADAIPEALKILPSRIPEGIRIVLSSRPDPTIDAWKINWQISPLEAASSENRNDARNYVVARFGPVSESAQRLLENASAGNFLALKLLCDDLAVSGEPIEAGARAMSERFGVGIRSFEEFYEVYWAVLRERCLSVSEDHFARVVDVLSVLTAVFEPMNRERFRQILGDDWTTAKFEASIRPISQFLRIEKSQNESTGSKYGIYHDTFREFMKDKIVFDLVRVHARMAKICMDEIQNGVGIINNDLYSARYILRHSGDSKDLGIIKNVITLKNVEYLEKILGSAAHLIDDIGRILNGDIAQLTFWEAIRISIIRDIFVSRRRHPLFGTELFLRARLEPNLSISTEIDALSDPDDRLLMLMAELLAVPLEERSLVFERIEQLARECSPRLVEACAGQIVDVDFAWGVKIAFLTQLPKDGVVRNIFDKIEHPTPARAIFRTVLKRAYKGVDGLREKVRALDIGAEKVFAQIALAMAQVSQNPEESCDILKEVLAAPNEDIRKHFENALSAYLIRMIVDTDISELWKPLFVFLRSVPSAICSYELRWVLLAKCEENPEGIRTTVIRIPDKQIRNWVLVLVGYANPTELAIGRRVRNVDIDRRVMKIAHSQDTRQPAEILKFIDSPLELTAAGRYAAELAEYMVKTGIQGADHVISLAARDSDCSVDDATFGANLELLKANVQINRVNLLQLLSNAYGLTRKSEIRPLIEDKRWAIGFAMSRHLVVAADDARPSIWKNLIGCTDSEKVRSVLATSISIVLPANVCVDIVRSPRDFGLGLGVDAANVMEMLLFPNTQALVLARLGTRLGYEFPNEMRNAFGLALEMAKGIPNNHQKKSVLEDVFIQAFRLSPLMGWKIFLDSGLERSALSQVLKVVCSYLWTGPREDAERRLRYYIDLGLSQQSLQSTGQDRSIGAAIIADLMEGEYTSLFGPDTGSTESKKAWAKELIEVLRILRDEIEKYDIHSMLFYRLFELAEPLAETAWESFEPLATDPDFRTKESENPFSSYEVGDGQLRILYQCRAVKVDRPVEYLSTVRALQRQSRRERENQEDGVVAVTLAAALAWDASLAVSLFQTGRSKVLSSVLEWLDFFEIKRLWTQESLTTLWSTLMEVDRLDDAVRTIGILAKSSDLDHVSSVELNEQIVSGIQVRGDGDDIIWAAAAEFCEFGDPEPLLVNLIPTADSRNIRHILTIIKSLRFSSFDVLLRKNLLASALHAMPEKRDNREISPIVSAFFGISIGEGFQHINHLKLDGENWPKSADAVVDAMVAIGPNAYPEITERFRVSGNRESEQLASLYILEALKKGFVIPEKHLLEFAIGVDCFEALFIFGSLKIDKNWDSVIRLSRKYLSGDTEADKINGLCRQGSVVGNKLPDAAFMFYSAALDLVARQPHPFMFLALFDQICQGASEHLPEEMVKSLLSQAMSVVEAYEPSIEVAIFPVSEAKSPAFCIIGICAWSMDQSLAERALQNAAAFINTGKRPGMVEYFLLKPLKDTSITWGDTKGGAIRYFLRCISEKMRTASADKLMSQCLDPRGVLGWKSEFPKREGDLLGRELRELAEWLSDWCTLDMAVSAHITLAHGMLRTDPIMARPIVEKARTIMAKDGEIKPETMADFETVSTIVTNRGEPGAALPTELGDPKWRKRNLPMFTYHILNQSGNRSELIKNLAQSLAEFNGHGSAVRQ